MQILEQIKKTREYIDYIEEHIANVSRAWVEVQEKCNDMFFIQDDTLYENIGMEVLNHDLSKMSEFEFVQYRKVFFPCNNEPKADITAAWQHHVVNNPHHWEAWTEKYKVSNGHPHWVIDCVHMIIDWMAMGYKFGDSARQFYEKNKEKIKIPDEAIKLIYEIFDRVES